MRYVLTSDEIKSVGIVDEWDWEGKKRKNQNKTKEEKKRNFYGLK